MHIMGYKLCILKVNTETLNQTQHLKKKSLALATEAV